MPGDKSISHRQVILAALAEGTSVIQNLLVSEDVRATMGIFEQLGVVMTPSSATIQTGDCLTVHGVGLDGLKATQQTLYCGNSGTTMRLMLGVLAAQPFTSCLTGDESLNRRPMQRVTEPLTLMGAQFNMWEEGGQRLIEVSGKQGLSDLHYDLPVASAQVKSALLLAGLCSRTRVSLTEPHPSRDHTERLLRAMGFSVYEQGRGLEFQGGGTFSAFKGGVPGDISSAAFFMVAGSIVAEAELKLCHVGFNPSRTGIIEVLKTMGAHLSMGRVEELLGEPVCDITVQASQLRGTGLSGALIPRLIDEIPVWAIAAGRATGTSSIRDARELRVKESNRIEAVAELMGVLGVPIQVQEDGFSLTGGHAFSGGDYSCGGDHRMAMAAAVAALVSQEELKIDEIDCVATSYPDFFSDLQKMIMA